jgi:hypothetical protein
MICFRRESGGMLNLDTHILIHALDGSLTSAEMKILNEDSDSDPADELMGATSLTHAIALVTRDRRIRATKLFPCLGG